MNKSHTIQISIAVLSVLVVLAGLSAVQLPRQAHPALSEALNTYREDLCSVQCVGERSADASLDAYRAQLCQFQCIGVSTFEHRLNAYRERLRIFQGTAADSFATALEAYRANLRQIQGTE